MASFAGYSAPRVHQETVVDCYSSACSPESISCPNLRIERLLRVKSDEKWLSSEFSCASACFASTGPRSNHSFLYRRFLVFPTISGNLLLARSKPREFYYIGFLHSKNTVGLFGSCPYRAAPSSDRSSFSLVPTCPLSGPKPRCLWFFAFRPWPTDKKSGDIAN
jgi:hypothetical protein